MIIMVYKHNQRVRWGAIYMSNANLIEVKCPNCNAQLKIGSDRQMFFCEYCGAQVFLDDGVARTEHTENININNTYKHIDEARVREIELEREIRNHQLELERKKKDSAKRYTGIIVAVAVVVFACGFFLIRNAVMDSRAKKQQQIETMNQQVEMGMVNIGHSSGYYIDENYKSVKANLEALGFTNIKLVNLHDHGLLDGLLQDFMIDPKIANTVESISINGKDSFSEYDCFNTTDQIVITYH